MLTEQKGDFTPPIAIVMIAVNELLPHPRNVRRHNRRQYVKLEAAIRKFGFLVPVLVDEANTILSGHARVAVAKKIGWQTVPCVRVEGLDDAHKRALMLAENKLHDLSDFDPEALSLELKALCDLGVNLEIAFETGEIDVSIDGGTRLGTSTSEPADEIGPVDPTVKAVTRPGDLWQLGRHRLLCGDALDSASYDLVLADEKAAMVFGDFPYNVPILGHVSGLGRNVPREFAMASGEMSPAEFSGFLASTINLLTRHSTDGSIHFICMDWRSIGLLLEVGRAGYDELKALCVWNKTNGGMGSLYRSKHELVAVFKHGKAPHTNNIELGRHGRYRTNVWDYPGANTFHKGRDEDLAAHPTVKPLALVADAIRDCSKRNALILDPFGGSGTTILAAERTGRRGALIEIDPIYVDVTIRRWETMTGEQATLAVNGTTFAEIQRLRFEAEGAAHD
jgi:hypothetical protein